MKVAKKFKGGKEVIKDREFEMFIVLKSDKKEKTMKKKISFEAFKKSISNLSAEAVNSLVEEIEKKKAKRYEYNKTYRKAHPLTKEQKAKRYEYNKQYNERKKAERDEILKKAEELGLIK